MPTKKRNWPPSKLQDDSEEESDSASPSPSARSSQRLERKKVRWEGQSRVDTEDAADPVDDSPSESEPEEQTCLAALCSHGNIGCAYYDPTKRIVFVLEDTRETHHFDLIRMLLEQVNADIVLTSSRADDDFIDALNEYMESAEGTLQIRPYKEFTPSNGRDRFLSLEYFKDLAQEGESDTRSNISHTASGSRNAYDFMRSRTPAGDPTTKRWLASIRISNFASIEASPLCMSSIGALLDHLVRQRALSGFEDDGIGSLDIRDIQMLALDQFMQINADALLSLQIFETESHASVHSNKTKEGLSLFGVLNNTKTTLGRSLLRTWLLRPSLSLSTIAARHDAVACFMKAENIATAKSMHNHLKGIKNTPRMMAMMKDGKAKLSDWQGLVKFTFHATLLRESLSELYQGTQVEIIKKVMAAIDVSTFKCLGAEINDIIDWEESICNDRICVRFGIDEDLDNRKHVYHGIDSVLSNVAEQVSLTVPETFAKFLNVVYFPQLGYLICVPMLDEWRTGTAIEPLEGWTFQFSSEDHVYFKSPEMQDMDIHIGDLHSTIVDRELEIIQELLEKVVPFAGSVAAACDACAELDCLLSFAEASILFEYRRPNMVEDNVIELIQARHPLQERVVDAFVPNGARLQGGVGIGVDRSSLDRSNLDSAEEWNSVLLCTGANACGKSVYLKQVAVIQVMAQAGCFVPAESATLGIVDKIFTRVSTLESVSKVIVCSASWLLSKHDVFLHAATDADSCAPLLQVHSAFMIDLSQVSLALRNCTPRSLVLLDEFGKGTLSTGSPCSVLRLPALVYDVAYTNTQATDGAGLFCGVLRHLLNRGSNCPKVLVATHFHDVFNEDILDPEKVPITFCHMQVMFTSSSGALVEPRPAAVSVGPRSASPITNHEEGIGTNKIGPADKITYLYRVAEGLSLDSHAAKCAELFGIPASIVDRAQYISNLLSTHQLGRLLDEGMTDSERSDLQDAEAICRRFLQWDLAESEADLCEGETKRRLGIILGRTVNEDTP